MEYTGMPPQADVLFLQAERRAERTVSLLRMLIAMALAMTFFIAVDPGIADTRATLLKQWFFAGATIAAYFLLGAGSYIASLRGFYRTWISWLTVTGDSVFLLTGVYSSLVNTGLAANFAVGMPSIWLIPVVLAFGSLRFNPTLQGYQIALLGTGVILITWNIGWDRSLQPHADPVLFYFFAGPPNLMRMAMVLLAGIVLVVAAVRTRTLLVRTIGETRHNLNLTRFLPEQIADRIAGDGLEDLRRGTRKNVSVLFVDIRGFTQLSENMEPEAVGAFITEFRHRIARAAGSSGGTIDKFIGDAAMIVFGLVASGRDDADDALKCADLIIAEIEDWNRQYARQPVKVGIGIHWGEVYCGAMGDETRLEYTVLGDTVNVAARLQDLSKVAGWPIVASGDVLKSANRKPDSKDWHALESKTLRGRSGEIRLFGSAGLQPGL